jgi:hypothetical protein
VAAPPRRTVQQQAIYDELLRRQQGLELSLAERMVLARRQFAAIPPFTIDTRPRWPEAVPVWVTVSGRFAGLMPRELRATPGFPGARAIVAYHGGFDQRRERHRDEMSWVERLLYEPGQQNIGVPPVGRRVVFHATLSETGDTVWEGDLSHPMVVEGTIDDVLRPVKSPELLASMIGAVDASLRLNDECSRIVFTSPSDPEFSGVTMGVVIEFAHRENVVANATLRWNNTVAGASGARQPTASWNRALSTPLEIPSSARTSSGFDYSEERWATVHGDVEGVCAADAADPEWRVRVRGDGAVALEDYNATAYWSGSLVVPLQRVREGSI